MDAELTKDLLRWADGYFGPISAPVGYRTRQSTFYSNAPDGLEYVVFSAIVEPASRSLAAPMYLGKTHSIEFGKLMALDAESFIDKYRLTRHEMEQRPWTLCGDAVHLPE